MPPACETLFDLAANALRRKMPSTRRRIYRLAITDRHGDVDGGLPGADIRRSSRRYAAQNRKMFAASRAVEYASDGVDVSMYSSLRCFSYGAELDFRASCRAEQHFACLVWYTTDAGTVIA